MAMSGRNDFKRVIISAVTAISALAAQFGPVAAVAEAAATELSKRENPKGFAENANIAQRGGDVAHVARERLEQELGDTVISDKRALNITNPPEELPFNDAEEVKE